MIAGIIYLIKFSISLSLVYAFYVFFLRKLTFYTWNRLYLLFYSLACFLIPFINLNTWFKWPEGDRGAVVIDAIPPFNEIIPANNTTGNVNSIVIAIFLAGCAFFLTRLILQYHSFRRLNKKAILLHQSGNIRIYESYTGSSFTLGNDIYLDTAANQTPGDIEKVLQHEMIHVRQKHWIDLLAGELFCLVNWFNPFAWLLRSSIRQNLEYIADRQVLQKGYDIKEYQYLLLRISNMPHVGMAAHFSLTGLKNRIHMINKMKSAHVHLARFALIFPFVLLLLFAFRTVNQSPINAIGIFSDTIPSDTTKDSLLIGVRSDSSIVNDNNPISRKGKYSKKRKPPVPPAPPAPPEPPVAPVPIEAKEGANVPEPPVAPAPPAEPPAPAAPVPPAKKGNR